MDIFDIMMHIIEAARLRIDYLDYERPFIEGLGTVQGSRLAFGLFRESLLCFAEGKSIETTNLEMGAQFLALGVSCDLKDTIKEFAEKCKNEVSALVLARVYSEMGMPVGEILKSVKDKLIEGRTLPGDQGVKEGNLKEVFIRPILESAKTRFDYKSFVDKSIVDQGVKAGTSRTEKILEYTLCRMSAQEDVPEEVTYNFLVAHMKEGSVPKWLDDFVSCCYRETLREVVAMRMINLAWRAGASGDKIVNEIAFRLKN